MKSAICILLLAGTAFAANTSAPAASTSAPKKATAMTNTTGPGPCGQIEKDCRAHGYIPGEANVGKGFWCDCLCPLVAPNFPEPSNNVLQVPSDSNLVASCKTHPRYAQITKTCADIQAKNNCKPHVKPANNTASH